MFRTYKVEVVERPGQAHIEPRYGGIMWSGFSVRIVPQRSKLRLWGDRGRKIRPSEERAMSQDNPLHATQPPSPEGN
jgi:hypothetical protein